MMVSGIMMLAKAQKAENWYRYYDAEKDTYGYKDAQGKIKISARFTGITPTPTFKNIIAVTEGRTNKSYYLLKNGQKVAKDSLYAWDMTYDCEQEGKIRFRDRVTDRVGFLDNNGKVVIPAVYNDARPFYNGLSLVIHNGKRICADGTPYKADLCEHWSWNGITALINNRGEIIADSVDITAIENLNWFSCKIVDSVADTTLYTSFKTKKGKYYTFINYQKEFTNWLYNQFLINLKSKALLLNCFDEIIVERVWKQTLRKTYSKAAFIREYGALLQKKMAAVKQGQVEVTIIKEELNAFTYSKQFKPFYTDCGEPNIARYPSFDVITSHYDGNHQLSYQEHFSFLKTGNGYKLIALALNPGYNSL
ncbi:WG repeat-containing protein [Mucilaginibacter sp. PAMB04168]|uniref:WG repeat-containing protein n=1 Tax=Mucilaginibacter sp. PAMB04168 TaxID=3138567 RepID=UPI0031F6274C